MGKEKVEYRNNGERSIVNWGEESKYYLRTSAKILPSHSERSQRGLWTLHVWWRLQGNIFSLRKEMLNPVGWNNIELHMLAGYLNLRAGEKPREISGSLYLFREKPLEFNEVLQEWCWDFHNLWLNPGRIVWISGRDDIIFSYILKSLSSEAGSGKLSMAEIQSLWAFPICHCVCSIAVYFHPFD